MTIAQEWIEAAYNRSSENDPGKLAQDAELLPHLDRVFQRFYALYAKARPEEAQTALAVVLGGSPATTIIPTGTIEVMELLNASANTIHLIPAAERAKRWHIAPSMYRVGNTLYSRSLGGDPLAGDTITLLLLDAPATLSDLFSLVDVRFPVRHHQLCIDALALYLDTKDDGRSGDSHGKILAEYQTALAVFASEYQLLPSALEWAHGPAKRSAIATSSPT